VIAAIGGIIIWNGNELRKRAEKDVEDIAESRKLAKALIDDLSQQVESVVKVGDKAVKETLELKPEWEKGKKELINVSSV
jgi:hypothetical protein